MKSDYCEHPEKHRTTKTFDNGKFVSTMIVCRECEKVLARSVKKSI